VENWLYEQIKHFNIFMLIVILCITSVISKLNLTKQMRELQRDLHGEFEEIKDEIRGNAKK
jgi:hypothetical protein